MIHSESFSQGKSNHSLMESRYNQEKEIILMNGDAYLDKNCDEDEVNDRTTTEEDETTQVGVQLEPYNLSIAFVGSMVSIYML